MKQIFISIKSKQIIFSVVMLFAQNCYAALKPLAESVKEKHELKIDFRSYNLFTNSKAITSEAFRLALSSGTTTEINTKQLFSIVQQAPSAITLYIPFNNGNIAVELVNINILTPDFIVRTSTNNIEPYTPGKYYRGIIKGNSNSVAAFSFFNNELYGIISDSLNGNIVVGKVLRPGNENEYIIYSDKNLLRSSSNICNTSDSIPKLNQLKRLSQLSSERSTVNCAKLYYEIDNNIYLSNNSNSTNTINWLTAVHNNVATLYYNDNISVALSEVFIWTTPDPYTGVDASAQLALFQSTRTSFNGDVGQLVSKDNDNGGLSAQTNALCTNLNYAYSDIDFEFSAVPTYSWTIEAITHEFGHLLGSPHTHSCSWPGGAIDNCSPTEGGCPPGPAPVNGGTIMSYCQLSLSGINFSNGFGPLPSAAIKNAINAAPCLGTTCIICPPAVNNECSSPATLSININCIYTAGSFCGATQSISTINCGSRQAITGNDVWYSITPSQNAVTISCQSSSNSDVVLSLYSGSCGSITLRNCSDATTLGGIETINASVTPGTTYLIRVYDFNGKTTGGDFGICVTQSCVTAPNNECSTATTLNVGTSCTFINGELCAATQSMPPVLCSGFESTEAYDLFYKIIPPQGHVKITCKSGITTDMVLGLYSGPCGNLTLLNCSDTISSGGTEGIDTVLTPGVTYYIRVYDWNGNINGTDFQLCAQYIPCLNPGTPTGATASASSICTGVSTTLSVTGTLASGSSWNWYEASCGGTPVGNGSSIIITPGATTTYYVRAENAGCYSACSNVTVTVILNPTDPTSTNGVPVNLCSTGTSALTVFGTLSSGASWHWYSSSCGGTPVGIGASIPVSPLTTTTYYVRAENGSCYSSCVNTQINVTTTPNDPVSASGNSPICAGGNTSLQVNGALSSGAVWHWYSVSCGGTSAGIGSSLIISPAITTTYFVRAENGTCFSNCSNILITVNPVPSSPSAVNASPAFLCSAGSSTLTVTGTLSTGATWHWYSASCGGNSVGTGSSISVSPLSTTTYYVRAENGTCSSNCINTSVSVATVPANPVSAAGNSPVCAGSNSTLQVNGTLSVGATWHWYSGSCGGTAVGTGASINVSPTTTTTYFVRAENSGCFSNCASVSITVNAVPSTPLSLNASPTFLCSAGSSTLSLTGTLSVGAVWKWYSGSCGGTPVGTGASISVSPLSTTIYFARAENGTCSSNCLNTAVSVATIPADPISASGTTPICAGSNSTLQVSGTLSSGATWHWYAGTCGGTPAGTGASISVSPASSTTYFVRAENGSCFSNCTSISVTVNSTPVAPLSGNASPAFLCTAGSSTLTVTGTLSPGATWQWYAGSCGGILTGTGVSISVTPLSTTNYFVRAENGTCSSTCININLSVASVPADPVSASASSPSVCAGDNSTLQVMGQLSQGATWQWYTESCGGVPAGTGLTVTKSVSVNTTYYVRAENGNCFSNCINTTVSVIPRPDDPISINTTSTSLCEGDSAILTETGNLSPGSNWAWYTGSCGGTLLGQGSSIIVGPTFNETYFIRAENANCQSNCQSLTLNVNPLPVQPFISMINDTLSVPFYSSYQWYWGTDITTFDQLGILQQQKAINSGYYFVVVTDINGCTASSDTIHFQIPDLISKINFDDILSIYPNPVDDLLNIKIKTALKENVFLKIFDNTSRLVYSGKMSKDKINVISMAPYANGLYQLLFLMEGRVYVSKILKK